MQEELEGMREVGEVLVGLSQAQGGGAVREREVVAQERREEELGLLLWEISVCHDPSINLSKK